MAWDSLLHDVPSSSSGTRLLQEFYSLVLDRGDDQCFLDEHGKRVEGEYLKQIAIIEDHFNVEPNERADMPLASLDDVEKCAYTDRFSSMSVISTTTTATAMSEDSELWYAMEQTQADHHPYRSRFSSQSLFSERSSLLIVDEHDDLALTRATQHPLFSPLASKPLDYEEGSARPSEEGRYDLRKPLAASVAYEHGPLLKAVPSASRSTIDWPASVTAG